MPTNDCHNNNIAQEKTSLAEQTGLQIQTPNRDP